ncbi:hypothetical protein [Parafrigoribacterium soli]|uniref:hypothetical protein n=1 Tax=Parafrigoribacterium soli TaxID=3144663 RepID=UPI0032EE69F4
MRLSRKRQKELKKLAKNASQLWDEQREVLDRASRVVRDAGHQATSLGREELAPRVRDAVDNHVRPGVAAGIAATRTVAGATKDKFVDEVLPNVTSALSSALAVIEATKNPQVREALGRVGKAGAKVGAKVMPTASKSSGPGKYILIGLGLVAVAGVAYAAWQTLRADDELWVSDEVDEEADVAAVTPVEG